MSKDKIKESFQLDESLSSLDHWMDAFKDIALVSIGIIASYLSLASGGSIGTTFIMIILAVSLLSGMFLPYKIAVTKGSILGVLSRYRALEIIIVILVSWLVPTTLIFIFPDLPTFYPSPSGYRYLMNLLTFGLPFVSFIATFILHKYGLVRIFKRVGVPDEFFEKYGKYPWGLGFAGLWVVSLTVVNVQLLLMQAMNTLTDSLELSVPFFARTFGGLIVLLLFSCSLSYFEPKRILTTRGELMFGGVGLGVLIAMRDPIIGFVVSILSLTILIRYSMSLPPPNIEQIIEEKENQKTQAMLKDGIFLHKYGKKDSVIFIIRIILSVLVLIGLLPYLIFDIQEIQFFSLFIASTLLLLGLYTLEVHYKTRLYLRFIRALEKIDDLSQLSSQDYLDLVESL